MDIQQHFPFLLPSILLVFQLLDSPIEPLGFATAVNYGPSIVTGSVAIGDFDGDGKLDLAVGYQSDPNNIQGNIGVLLNAGNGVFANPINYAVGHGPNSIKVGDFNGDGKVDLAAVNNNDNTTSVLLNTTSSSLSFSNAVIYGLGTESLSVAVGDFNGDGKPDLALANFGGGSSSGAGGVSVMLNNGNGTFALPVNFYAGVSLTR